MGGTATESLGTPIIVLNNPGGGTLIGTKYVVSAKPDGYTLLSIGSAIIAAMAVRPDCPYTIDDFTPIIRLATTSFVIFVKADAPWKNLKDLINYAKENPGKLTYGSPGVGTSMHLGFEHLIMISGINIAHVPFKGDAPVITAVLGGHVNIGIVAIAPLAGHLKEGTLKSLSATASTPPEDFPKMPTLTSEGYPEATVMSWHGVVGPKGLPKSVVSKLSDAYSKSIKNKSVIELMNKIGLSVSQPIYQDDFGNFLKTEYSNYSKVSKKLKIEIK